MKIDKIFYQRIFPLGPYLNERVGVEIKIEEGESPEEAFSEAKKFVSKLGSDLEDKIPVEKTNGIDQEFEALKKAIIDCPVQAAAIEMLENSSFRLNMQLKEIIKYKFS